MHKKILIVVGITLLFLGVTVQPAVATPQPQELPDVDGLFAQIETFVNEILQKYGHIPLISNFGNFLLGLIGLLLYTFIFIISILIDIVALILAIFVFYTSLYF